MFAKKKSSGFPILIIAMLMLAFGFYIGKNNDSKEEKSKEQELAKTVNAQNIDEKDNFELQKDAKITFKITYDKCNHMKEKSESISDSLVGFNKKKIQEYLKFNYPRYKISQIKKDSITLEKNVDSYCDAHYEIGEEDGKIVVYKYEDGEKVRIKKTDYTINNLPKADAEQLIKGIVVESMEKVNEMLEDFVS